MRTNQIQELIDGLAIDQETKVCLEKAVGDLTIWLHSAASWGSEVGEPLLNSYFEEKWVVTISSATSRKKYTLKGQAAMHVLLKIDEFNMYIPRTSGPRLLKSAYFRMVKELVLPLLIHIVPKIEYCHFIDELVSIQLGVDFVDRSFEKWLNKHP